MHLQTLALAALPMAARAINVVMSNDDGWAEINIRQFYDSLAATSGFEVLISAPALNRSGTGSLMAPPTTLLTPCEFDSCPAGSPPTGFNASMPRFNYVNSFPATSMQFGIEKLAPATFDGAAAELAVAGFNVGSNLGITTLLSGTVGAAVEAVDLGVPGVAFSGSTGSQTAWDAPVQTYMTVYAALAANLTAALVAAGTPYLPAGVWLNVNFSPSTDDECADAGEFGFVLSRIYDSILDDDVDICDNGGLLPTETDVIDTAGCWASVSVGKASDKLDADKADQEAVYTQLKSILTCLPSS